MSRRMMLRNQLVLVGVSILLAAAGCSRRDAFRIVGPDSKQYPLQAIDGHALPYQISQSASVTTVVNDMLLTVVSDDTWTTVGHETVTTNGAPAQVIVRGSGVFAATDVAATFRNANGAIVWTGEPLAPGFLLIDTLGTQYRFGP